MNKVKLSKKSVQQLVSDCESKEKSAYIKEMPKRLGGDITTTNIDLRKLYLPENIERLQYLLGQVGVYHTGNKVAIYEQMAYSQDKTDWTENDPVALNQLVSMGLYTGLISNFERVQVNGKDLNVTNLQSPRVKIKPVTHDERILGDE